MGASALTSRFLAEAATLPPLYRVLMEQYIAARLPSSGDGDHLADNSLVAAAEATPIVAAMDWTLIRAPVGSLFIIGDQPAFSLQDERAPQTLREAVGVFMQMPLSADCLLRMERSAVPAIGRASAARDASAALVTALNRLSLAMADRYVYTSSPELAMWAAEHRGSEEPIHLPGRWIAPPPPHIRQRRAR